MDELLIKPEHVRHTTGYCMAGVNEFCRCHGIDFRQFIKQGIPASRLIATGDALAIALVEQVIEHEANNAGGA